MTEKYPSEKPSLAGIRLKLDRAEEHLDHLEGEIVAYTERDPYSVPEDLEVESDGSDEWFVCRLRVTEAPNPEWGLRVGEFLHNSRSALDNLVWQLVLLNEQEPGCRNQFPIYTKPAKSPSRRRSRLDAMLGGVSPADRAFIEELQPDAGGHIHRRTKDALAWLVTLSNTDKHRYLHPALGVLDPEKVSQTRVDSTHPIIDHRTGVRDLLNDGAELLAIRTSPEARVKMEGQVAFAVAFGSPRVTVHLLDGIHQQVSGIVERFAPAFD